MDFSGFSTDSFEQFIRALALKLLGPGVTVFGNGPDGGREASFNGKVSFPHPPTEFWEGYGVLQAKFKEKTEGTQIDQNWAIKQLEGELNLWQGSTKRNPKPDYFIFCTNVELTSATNGGHDRAIKLLEDNKLKLGLKDFAIWDANQLKGYIDSESEIRNRFSCFFTTGDLLAALAKKISSTPDPEVVLTSYLCREILVDEDARLSQAGDRSEDRIRLANVFVDLPTASVPNADVTDESIHRRPPRGSLDILLRAATNKLDPLALHEQAESTKRIYGRYVFIGGPGSGKSTLGQFLAQIHRAALLDRRPKHKLEQKIVAVINGVKKRCQEDLFKWPSTPRYPFKIELNSFAKALAAGQNGGVLSLSDYLRKTLSSDFQISHTDIREIFKTFPTMLILDGLDEVPSSSNRRDVIQAIQNFLNEARELEADLMIISSSRPEGYKGEFDGEEVAHRYLLSLPQEIALTCANNYLNAKAGGGDPQRAGEALQTITEALNNPLVARLMQTPLQVTFMVTVVAASGKPSESRWQLFNDYYRIIYERELQKAVRPFDKALNERRQDIDALHHEVGFLLQCRAEFSGGTKSDLGIDEFETLVINCLQENGLSTEEISTQKDLILGAANLRLVFLTSRTPSRLSFDVRSLQEYMAAAWITDADSDIVIQRMESIAHSAYWRNTLLFAIGRFFVDPHLRNHRNRIRILCEDLNLKTNECSKAKIGSLLALDILESGTIGNVPLISRSLAANSLQLLGITSVGASPIPQRLANIYTEHMETEYKSAISVYVNQNRIGVSTDSWKLIFLLENRGVNWAGEFIKSFWPTKSSEALKIMSAWIQRNGPDEDDEVVIEMNKNDYDRLEDIVPLVPVLEFGKSLPINRCEIISEYDGGWVGSVIRFFICGKEDEYKLAINRVKTSIDVRFAAPQVNELELDISDIKSAILKEGANPEWKAVLGVIEYEVSRTSESLSQALKLLASITPISDWKNLSAIFSWPISCCLNSAQSVSELNSWASDILNNNYLNCDSRIALESSWTKDGIELDALIDELFPGGPTLMSGIRGFQISHGRENVSDLDASATMYKKLQLLHNKPTSDILAWIISFHASCLDTWSVLAPRELQHGLLPYRHSWRQWDIAMSKDATLRDTEGWLEFYNAFGNLEKIKFIKYNWHQNDGLEDVLLENYLKNPEKQGLLRILGYYCASGRRVKSNIFYFVNIEEISSARLKLALVLVRLANGGLTDADVAIIGAHIAEIVGEDSETEAKEMLVASMGHHLSGSSAFPQLYSVLTKLIPYENERLRGELDSLLSDNLQSMPSGYSIEDRSRLHLPSAFDICIPAQKSVLH